MDFISNNNSILYIKNKSSADMPHLIVLVGLPGAGKSGYAKSLNLHNKNVVWISSDAIREELWGDASDQREPSAVFEEMKSRTLKALKNGVSVIYDATNMTRQNRASIINACPLFVNIDCKVIWAPLDDCIDRDRHRDRTVGENVIMKMAKRFQFPFWDEGFDSIEIIRSANDFNSYSYELSLKEKMAIDQDNPHHSLSVLDHCRLAEKYGYGRGDDTVALAARWHDCGKERVKDFHDGKGNKTDIAHYYGHEGVSAWMVLGLSYLPNLIEIAWLISSHMLPYGNSKYYKNLPSFLKSKLDKLHECDEMAHYAF